VAFRGSANDVSALLFSRDRRWLAVGYRDGSLMLRAVPPENLVAAARAATERSDIDRLLRQLREVDE
jgi:hypothetical protein